MPGKVIGQHLDYGYPGTFSRNADCIIINRRGTGEISFGAPVVMNDDNTVTAFGDSNTAAEFIGVAVREVKQQTNYLSNNVKYIDGDPTDVITRGSVVVGISSGTPKANGPVYIRIAENASYPESKIGDFVAEADGSNTVELDNVVFTTGKKDGNNVAEVTVLSRKA